MYWRRIPNQSPFHLVGLSTLLLLILEVSPRDLGLHLCSSRRSRVSQWFPSRRECRHRHSWRHKYLSNLKHMWWRILQHVLTPVCGCEWVQELGLTPVAAIPKVIPKADVHQCTSICHFKDFRTEITHCNTVGNGTTVSSVGCKK